MLAGLGLQRLQYVKPRHGSDSGCRSVKNRNEHQCPTGRSAGGAHSRHCEKTNNDVGQSCGADHQRSGEGGHIKGAAANRGGVFLKAQIQQSAVEFLQQIRAIGKGRTQPDLRHRLTSQLQADKNRRHGVGKNQHTELGDLGVGNPFHPAKNGIEKNDDHPREQAGLIVSLEKTREGYTDTFHLTDHIRHRANDQANHRHYPRSIGVVAIANELRDGELAVFPQVWRDQHGQNHIAAGPAHQKHRATIAVVRETNETRHGDE